MTVSNALGLKEQSLNQNFKGQPQDEKVLSPKMIFHRLAEIVCDQAEFKIFLFENQIKLGSWFLRATEDFFVGGKSSQAGNDF